MKSMRMEDSAVVVRVNNEHFQGFRTRERRCSLSCHILLGCWWSAPVSDSLCFSVVSRVCVCGLGALTLYATCGVGLFFSTFLLSRVTDCLVTSNLAEVKLLFLPSSSDTEGSGWRSSSVSSSWLEPDDLLRIESDGNYIQWSRRLR